MLIIRLLFISACTVGASQAKTQLSNCPESLSAAHVQILKDQKIITLTNVTFNLDGGSEQKVHEHDPTQDAPFAYTRTESHKIACWYKSQSGYICLREK
jgi:hypothetical protein